MIYQVVNTFSTRFKAPMLRSDLCEYSDGYVVVKGKTTVEGTKAQINKELAFKNNAVFKPCILKIINTFTGNAEDLDIVILMLNLIENSGNYSKT